MAAIPYPSSTTVYDALTVAAPASGKKLFVIEKTFDLDTVMVANGAGTGKILTTDIVNLFSLPANTMIVATGIKVLAVAVGAGGTTTAKLRFGTTDIGATADVLTLNTVAVGGNGTVSLPLANSSAALVNLVFAVGSGTITKNPTIRVTMVCVDLS